jgi:hypothetical protein
MGRAVDYECAQQHLELVRYTLSTFASASVYTERQSDCALGRSDRGSYGVWGHPDPFQMSFVICDGTRHEPLQYKPCNVHVCIFTQCQYWKATLCLREMTSGN